MPDIAEPFILVLPGQHLSQTYFRMGGAQGQELSGQRTNHATPTNHQHLQALQHQQVTRQHRAMQQQQQQEQQ
eukprot:scaffold179727_cov20-Tisochrysis_lutea.AAC.1